MCKVKDVPGYEGLYQVNENGEVISRHRNFKVMKQQLKGRNGHLYAEIGLTKNGVQKQHRVHRLVAEAFVPNPSFLPEVNHKDNNPLNNKAENLEWCTRQYNIDYSKSKPVMQINGDKIIAIFKSVKEAGRRTGIKRTCINNVVNGRAKTAGGFNWKYCEC